MCIKAEPEFQKMGLIVIIYTQDYAESYLETIYLISKKAGNEASAKL